MERTFTVTHVTLPLSSTFGDFTTRFEEAIGRFIEPEQTAIEADPEAVLAAIKERAGRENLYLFPTGNPGKMLHLQGGHNKLRQYGWGNPLMAGSLIRINIGVALYAPFRMIVYETDTKELFAEYDLPSTYFQQFGEEVMAVGLRLDQKLKTLIEFSDGKTV